MLTLASVALLFLALERLFPTRQQPVLRPRLGTDLLFVAGQQFLFGSVALGALTAVHRVVGGWLPRLEMALWAQVGLALLLGDLSLYWFHRACHRIGFLWRVHQVHHSSEHLDWAAAYREHPLDGVLTQVVLNLPAMLLGVPLGALAGLAVFRGLWAIFIHSNVRLPLGPLLYVFGSPRLHHWHHAKHPARVANFGNLSPWTDLLFGTFELPEREVEFELGVSDPVPRSWWGLLVHPFQGARTSLVLVSMCVVTAYTSFAGDVVDGGGADAGMNPGFLFAPRYLPASKSFGPVVGHSPAFGGLGGLRSGPLGEPNALGAGGAAREGRVLEPSVRGALAVEVVNRVVRARLSQVHDCARTDAGFVAGTVTIKFVVGSTGKVDLAQVAQSTVRDAGVEACALREVSTLRFPAPNGGGVAVVHYPFTFEAR